MITKDEIKNRISMALKAPILQQGFEIICKENEWHYVKDGDLPPERLEGKQILVVPQKHKFTEPMFVVGYYLLSEYRVGVEKKFYFDSDCRNEIDKPYAWKEIVLPEE